MENTRNNLVYSVSEFISFFNQTLEYAYPNVEIEGEVASFKINQEKYVFFDIKDEDGSVGCFMTIWQLRMPIEDGMKVIISAVPKLTKWGKFSLTVKSIKPSGEGALKKSYELLKSKLESEGLFSVERKRFLPEYPTYIAIISSIQAAGYADFVKILNDRWGGIKVDVANVQVQGESAPDQIIKAINYFNQRDNIPEVLVIIRGGGSADDLATFNDEPLIRVVASSRVPTLIGVGHETDVSLTDLAADVRAATPSNAAQILVPDKHEVIRSVNSQINSLIPRLTQLIDQQRQIVLEYLVNTTKSIGLTIDDKINEISNYKNVLKQLNPNKILTRGYAIIKGNVKIKSMIEIETIKDIIKAEVKNVIKK